MTLSSVSINSAILCFGRRADIHCRMMATTQKKRNATHSTGVAKFPNAEIRAVKEFFWRCKGFEEGINLLLENEVSSFVAVRSHHLCDVVDDNDLLLDNHNNCALFTRAKI